MASHPASPFSLDLPLVDRECGLAAMRAALRAALVGPGSLVVVGRAADGGRTCLAEMFLAEAERQGVPVPVGCRYALAKTPSDWPWSEALTRAPRFDGAPALDFGGGEASRATPFAVVRDHLAALTARDLASIRGGHVEW